MEYIHRETFVAYSQVELKFAGFIVGSQTNKYVKPQTIFL